MFEQQPLISIIIPTYNRAELLAKTLESIINQSYSNIEIIIVSDGCTDNTRQIVEDKNDKRVVFISIEQNTKLPAKARNIGLKIAKGTFIAFCDDDDIWLPSKLDKQIAVMNRYPSVGLCCTAALFLHPNGTIKKYKNIIFYLKHVLVSLNIIPAKYLLVAMNHIVNSSVLIRREIIEQVGYITEEPKWRASEDFDYWFRISGVTNIFYIKRQSILYRLHQNQISTDKEGKMRFFELLHQYDLNSIQKKILTIRKMIFERNIV